MTKNRAPLVTLLAFAALLFVLTALSASAASPASHKPGSAPQNRTQATTSSTVINTGTGTSTATATQTPGVSATPTCVSANPTWTVVPTVPAPGRYNAGGVVGADGKFYVFGGLDSNNNNTPIANTDAFDPATNFWDSYAPLDVPRGNVSVGRVGNLIYVAGGNLDFNNSTAENSAYDVTANSWTARQPMPTAIVGGMGAGLDSTGRFYVFGGNTDPFTVSDQTWIYNPGANTWTTGALMPGPKTFGASAVWSGKIYVFGGADGVNLSNSLWAYDPVANSWSVKSPGPVARFKPGMSARNGKLYITGGGTDPSNIYGSPSASVDVYDIGTDTWTTAHNMLYSKLGQAQGTLDDGRIIAATGMLTTSFSSRVTEILPPGEPCLLTPTATTSPAVTATGTPTGATSPTMTSTPCPINFSDVPNDAWFYPFVQCLYCRGAISGYADGTFRPYNNTTRGQMTKIVVTGFALAQVTPTGAPTFNDVPANSPFYAYVETAAADNIVSGYNCGGPGEPCPGLYFRPNANVTRGQLSKIVVVAASQVYGWSVLNPATPTFTDVPPGSPFYTYVETAVCHQIITGYADMTFRPGNNATRAQISKIVCQAVENAAQCSP